jgi:hypothetical protein
MTWLQKVDYSWTVQMENVDVLTVFLAEMLGEPVKDVAPVAQVGRFAVVRYTPLSKPDPEAVIAVGPGCRLFNDEARKFQRARERRGDETWEDWYRWIKRAAQALLKAMSVLNPTPEESALVVRWVALVCARGQALPAREQGW